LIVPCGITSNGLASGADLDLRQDAARGAVGDVARNRE